ncbi:MAG: YCF48-related protein [Acidobacteriota bacterium]
MINKQTVTSAVILGILMVTIGGVALAQQGWARLQTIKTGAADSGINSVFYDGDDIWVVGSHGLIARSHDDGQTFHEMNQGVDAGLNDVSVRRERICIVGDAGTILRSTDGGRSFVKILRSTRRSGGASGPAELDLYSVQFADEDHVYIVGDRGLILASTDGGATWREQHSGSATQLFHLSLRGEHGWVVGTGGVILHTDNGGRNWYPQRSGVNEDLNRVYMVTDRVGLITGDNGTLLRTENSGATWERVSLNVREPLFGMSFIDNKTGWVVGYKGRIIRTYDGGRNWVEQNSNTGADLFSVSFHKNRGYAIGRDGLVMRYYEKR